MEIQIEQFRRLCESAFKNNGFSDEEAEISADEIVEAECRGKIGEKHSSCRIRGSQNR